MFVQVWLELICLPVCIFLLTTPLQTISVVCATVGAFASIAAYVHAYYNWEISAIPELVNLEEIVAAFHSG